MNYWLVSASVLSFIICLLHIFGGGPTTVPHLIEKSDQPGGVCRMTAYYAWHMVTITIAAQAVAFAMAARSPASNDLALFAASGALLFTIWSLMMIAIHKLKPLLFPQWILFLPVAIVGFIGVYF